MSSFQTYTNVVEKHQLTTLRCLHGMLTKDPIQTRDQFSNLMKATLGSGFFEPRDISNDLGFSASTVYRWAENKSAPHPCVWPLVQGWLLKAILNKIEAVETLRCGEVPEEAQK